jgi:hypothetical protein
MDAVDFLDSDAADLPKTRVGDYPTFVDQLFDDYRSHLERIAPRTFIDRAVKQEIPRVVALSTAIRQVIASLTASDRLTAYNQLDITLQGLGAHLQALMPSGDMSRFLDPLYRFRIVRNAPYTSGELFHIPFYLRRIVGPMRYSVAGLPCLYLGGSTQVCWRELGEPDLATVSVSRFHAVQNTNLRVLNFGHRLPLLAAYVASEPQDFTGPTTAGAVIKAQVACWPLIAACSVRVPDRNSPERPEYLLPQLVLEWITRTHKFHGIRYFSTHYTEYPDDPKTYMNYVFPARTTPPVGYCSDLCGLFELTNPVSWAQAKSTPSRAIPRPRYKTRMVIDTSLEAEFGRAEDGLLTIPVHPLTSVPAELLESIRRSVQTRAFSKWDGHSHGDDWKHWFDAKRELGIPDDVLI